MQFIYLPVVNWQSVQVDEPRWRLRAFMTTHDDDAFVDVGVLAHIDVAGLMAGQNGVDVVALSQYAALI